MIVLDTYTPERPTDAHICHHCNHPVTIETTIADTHDDCLNDCLCYVCRETRREIAEDRAAELVMAWGEAS